MITDDKNRTISRGGKRSAHVKWRNKTISLGIYYEEEIESVCRRAQDITRKLRLVRPRRSVESVKQELERLGIRVVTQRSSQQAKKDGNPNEGRHVSLTPREASLTHQIETSILYPSATDPHDSTETKMIHPYHTYPVTNIAARRLTFSKSKCNLAHTCPLQIICNIL